MPSEGEPTPGWKLGLQSNTQGIGRATNNSGRGRRRIQERIGLMMQRIRAVARDPTIRTLSRESLDD